MCASNVQPAPIRTGCPEADPALPLLVEPASAQSNLVAWLRTIRHELETRLLKSGMRARSRSNETRRPRLSDNWYLPNDIQ